MSELKYFQYFSWFFLKAYILGFCFYLDVLLVYLKNSNVFELYFSFDCDNAV